MSEKKKEKTKRRRWLRRIGWGVLILLAVLLGIRLVAGVVLQRRFNARIAELRKAGEPLALLDLAPPEIPAHRNAAVFYEQAFKQLDLLPEESVERLGNLAGKSEPLTPEELRDARALLGEAAEVLRMLHKGAERSECRYTIDYTGPAYAILLPHLAKVRNGGRLLKLSALVKCADGKSDEAVTDCVRTLKLARSVHDGPLLTLMLVEWATTQTGLRALERVMGDSDPSATALQDVLRVLGDVGDRSQFVHAMRSERCLGLDVIELVVDNPARLGNFVSTPPDGAVGFFGRMVGWVFRPLLLSDGLCYLDVMDEFIELAKTTRRNSGPEWDRVNAKVEGINRGKPWRHPIAALILPTLRRVAIAFDQGVVVKGCGKIAIALRLHRMKRGTYPETLAALAPEFIDKLPIDPFSGKDFIYRREGKGFIVYSVGENGKDDGGAWDAKKHDLTDIGWKCSR